MLPIACRCPCIDPCVEARILIFFFAISAAFVLWCVRVSVALLLAPGCFVLVLLRIPFDRSTAGCRPDDQHM